MERTPIPDFVATREIVSRGARRQEILRHHGGWLRTDGVQPLGPFTDYENRGRCVRVRVYRAAEDGCLKSLDIQRGRSTLWHMRDFVKTDETAEHLDEPCAVWHDYYFGNGERKFDPTRVLVSHDGIELRRDYRHGTTEQLTALTRGAVSPDEVTPPADLLDWRTWPAFVAAAPPRPAGSPPDFVARGQNPYLGSEDTLRVTRRRRYPWTYCDAVCQGRRRTLDIENDYGDGGGLLFETSWKGEFERLIARVARATKLNLREQNCRETGKAKTILGETCRYIELEEFAVGGRWITADGIPLETDEEARSGRFSWRAIELERRSPEFSEVMPPAEILDPAKWDLTR